MTWPPAVEDGSGSLPCSECGAKIDCFFRVTDKAWREVVSHENRLNVSCLPCFARLAEDRGEDIAHKVDEVQFVGPGYTVVLVPTAVVRHDTGAVELKHHHDLGGDER